MIMEIIYEAGEQEVKLSTIDAGCVSIICMDFAAGAESDQVIVRRGKMGPRFVCLDKKLRFYPNDAPTSFHFSLHFK